MADGDLAAEVDVRKEVAHHQRRLDRLARAEVQQVDVGAVGLVGQVGGDEDRQPLGVRRTGGAVGRQAGAACRPAPTSARVGVEDVGDLAVQAERDVLRLLG